jgi:hypothetical protein
MIPKEQGVVGQKSIISCIKRICWRAKLVLYPHAYALYDYEIKPPAKPDEFEHIYDENIIDYLLITSKYDYNYFSKRINSTKIKNLGALGYTDWWKEQVIKYSISSEVNDIAYKPHKVKVLFTLRGPHKIYLASQNFELLMESALQRLFELDDVLVIVKPHPRQDINLIYTILEKFPKDKWVISNINTFTLAILSNFTLSFWSSSITDSLAMGIPTIEYYKYSENFSQTLLDDKGEIVSFYTKLNLALRANTPAQLNIAIERILNNYDKVRDEQLFHFNTVFSDRFESKSLLAKFLSEEIFLNTADVSKSMTIKDVYDWVRLMLWGIKNREKV